MSFRDRVAWDGETGAYHDGSIRYMFLRPDALMGILHALPEAQRPAVLKAMATSIRRAGGQSARSYGAADAEALLSTIAETAPQLGWGRWQFVRPTATLLDLTVENSPFVGGYGPSDGPVCAPIVGMLGAVAEMVFGADAHTEEVQCAATGTANCRFVAEVAL
ncbi:MAG: V4R domain-containing protein [Pseudomonadota bacterium]